MSAATFLKSLFATKPKRIAAPPPPPAAVAESAAIRKRVDGQTSSFRAVVESTRRHSTASCQQFRTQSGALMKETQSFMKAVVDNDTLSSDPGLETEG